MRAPPLHTPPGLAPSSLPAYVSKPLVLAPAGPAPSTHCFARAVLACGRAGMEAEARGLLAEMQENGMAHDAEGEGINVEALGDYVENADWQEAANFAQTLQSLYVSPTQTSYSM
jgi:pentatricopeptide repeat protein